MANRPYTDITLAKANKPIKNGSGIVGVGFTADYDTLDTNVSVNPTILTIQSKYGNRFYNGNMVYVWGGIDGGGASSGAPNITPVTTNAPTNTPTASVTPTATPASTLTATPTSTATPTNTVTPTSSNIGATPTPTSSSTSPAATATATPTPSVSVGGSGVAPTPTATSTPTVSVSANNGSAHAEALDWANRVVANGGSVSNSTLNAVSSFCSSVDSLGLRDRFYRLNLICGNNLAASLVPLYRSFSSMASPLGSEVDTNFNLVSGDYAETGSDGGLKGSGFGTGINTTISSSLFEDPANFHFACYVFGTPYNQYNSTIMGSDGYFNGYRSRVGFSVPPSSANDRLRAYAITDTTGANYTTNGLICAVMSSGAVSTYGGSTGLLTENYATTNSNATVSPLGIYLLGLNQAGVSGPSYCIGSPAGASYYSIGRSLTATQYNNLYNVLTTFQTALGRNQ